jgi:phage I-like protein
VTQRFGYWTDLSTIELSDKGPTWIQAMPLGKYKHPFFGDIDINDERVKRFADNVNSNVRGTELDIDYDHKMTTGEAAGWVKAADARPNGLYLLVDWTARARQAIREKAYRYFSPEFTDEWEHPKTQVKYKDVLFGGGITNRPFLKDIAPVNASELVLGDQEPKTGGRMDPKQLRKALRLPEDASDEQVSTAVETLAQANEGAGPPGGTGPASDQQQQQQNASNDGGQNNAGEQGVSNGGTNANQQQLSELAKTNPAIAQLMEQQEQMRKALAEQQTRIRLSDMTTKVTQLNEKAGQKGVAFPAVVLNELPQLLTDMSDTVGKGVVGLFEKLLDTRLVQLGEKGHQQIAGGNTADGQMGLHNAVVALMEKDKDLTYADAMDKVLSEKPELFDSYRADSYAGRE